jgi:hypothetical protein
MITRYIGAIMLILLSWLLCVTAQREIKAPIEADTLGVYWIDPNVKSEQ